MNWSVFLDSWSPWRLRRRLAGVQADLDREAKIAVDSQRDYLLAEEQKRRAESSEAELRALVMNLRVTNTPLQGRTGFAVTAFIPNETVDRLRHREERTKLFVDRVAAMLVRRAMLGLFHVRDASSRPAAIVWAPLGPGSNKREMLAFNSEVKCLNDKRPDGTLTKL